MHHIRNGNRDQPVIMFTGVWTPKTEQQVRALGVTEIVKKGSSLDRLENSLRRALKSSRPAESSTTLKTSHGQ